MIGRQIQLYLTDADELRLLELLRSRCGAVLVAGAEGRGYERRIPGQFEQGDWRIAYLSHVDDVGGCVDALRSGVRDAAMLPAVQYLRPLISDGELRGGRFWFSPVYAQGRKGEAKPATFVAFADLVIKQARAALRRVPNVGHLGEEAASLVRDRRVELH
jgi:hypothetical protein